MLASASVFSACVGIAVDVICFFMALLSSRGISTPSLPAQGEQRRSSTFNIPRDIPLKYAGDIPRVWLAHIHKLEAELKNVESELKVAKGAETLAMRARAENIRN